MCSVSLLCCVLRISFLFFFSRSDGLFVFHIGVLDFQFKHCKEAILRIWSGGIWVTVLVIYVVSVAKQFSVCFSSSTTESRSPHQ